MKKAYLPFLMTLSLLNSCGILPEEEASTTSCREYLEDENWTGAITCYEDGDYDDAPAADLEAEEYLYLAMWAGSYGGKYGLIGSSIIESASDPESSSQLLSTKVEAEASAGTLATSIADMSRCMELILAIPEEYRLSSSATAGSYAPDLSILGSFYSLFLFELQKRDFNDSLNDSSLTDEELLSKADAVLATLENGGQVVDDPDLQAQIDAKFDELDSQPGANNKEKLEALLGS